MLGFFSILKRLMTRLRSPAIICGAEPVLTWHRSSSMVTSRTQNTGVFDSPMASTQSQQPGGISLLWR